MPDKEPQQTKELVSVISVLISATGHVASLHFDFLFLLPISHVLYLYTVKLHPSTTKYCHCMVP